MRVDRLLRERMSREAAESRVRLQEDQLAELQEELRRVSETSSDSLRTVITRAHKHTRSSKNNRANNTSHPSLPQDVMTLQADLAEAGLLWQRQEETLRQRERELTALKGALKEEVECHDREMEALREQYGQDMENLKRTMEQVTQVLRLHHHCIFVVVVVFSHQVAAAQI